MSVAPRDARFAVHDRSYTSVFDRGCVPHFLPPSLAVDDDERGTALNSFFLGNAMGAIDRSGRLCLPPFVLSALRRRGDATRILLAWHESDSCIVGQDERHQEYLFDDLDRRRRSALDLKLDPAAHQRRMRIAFGSVIEQEIDARGRVFLPPSLRHRAQLGDSAFVIGTGSRCEIWSPDRARRARDRGLRELVAARADQQTFKEMA